LPRTTSPTLYVDEEGAHLKTRRKDTIEAINIVKKHANTLEDINFLNLFVSVANLFLIINLIAFLLDFILEDFIWELITQQTFYFLYFS
jgi:hypothetical protein